MSYWGKVIGGMAGFAMGGPVGMMFGAALGHAADEGVVRNLTGRLGTALPYESVRAAAMLGRRDQVLAIGVTVLAAKLAKCDGAVNRAEIQAFKTCFGIPDAAVAEIGRLFDSARDSPEGFEAYAMQLGQAFADDRAALARVLLGLRQIARADGPINRAETDFLNRVANAFGIDPEGAGPASPPAEDPYQVLGIRRGASFEEIRTRWKQLVRETHPDSLASRGEAAAVIAAASDRVARINAAYDDLKRDRKP